MLLFLITFPMTGPDPPSVAISSLYRVQGNNDNHLCRQFYKYKVYITQMLQCRYIDTNELALNAITPFRFVCLYYYDVINRSAIVCFMTFFSNLFIFVFFPFYKNDIISSLFACYMALLQLQYCDITIRTLPQ